MIFDILFSSRKSLNYGHNLSFDQSLVNKPKRSSTKTLLTFSPAPFSCKNPTPSESLISCCSQEGFKVSKKSAGKNSTSDFVPNFHGMLNDLTTIGVQRVTGSSPLRDNYFFYSFFKIFKPIRCVYCFFRCSQTMSGYSKTPYCEYFTFYLSPTS